MKHLNLQKIILITIFGIVSISSLKAQRLFVASENGIMSEIKNIEVTGKTAQHISLPKKTISTISNPLIFYIYSEYPIDIKELSFYSTFLQKNRTELFIIPQKVNINKQVVINQLTNNLYSVMVDKSVYPYTGKVWYTGLCTFQSAIGIKYKPNKNNKKIGGTEQYWFFNRTEEDYDFDDIKWSDEDAMTSINEIIETKQTTKQLFASLVPEPQPQVIQGNGQIQYVVVQNPNVPVQGNEISQQPKEPEIPNSDVDVNIPFSGNKIENGFALIIANEDYTKVAAVPFAKRDGKKVEEYINKALGIDKGHITLLENATLNDMRYELSRLQKISDAYNGDCSFIVYYCGHGIPDEKNGNGYLLPVDGYGTDVNTAYSLAELYSQLGNLNARKTILFTDACFSGAGKEGSMLVAARGIAIKSKANEASGNLIAFSACQGDETAYSYKDKGHGLMTYYFLKKLQESQGKATLGELEEYIIDNVGKTAIVTNGKPQTPSVSVSPTLQNDWRRQTLFE